MNVVLLNVDTGEILNSTRIAPNKTYSDVLIDYIDKDNGYILMSFNPTNNMRVKLYKVDVNSSNEISVTDVSNNSYAIQTINGATQDYTFGYLKFINKNISYYVGKYGSGNLDYNIYTAFMVGVNEVIKCNESIIPNDELSYAIIDGEIKQFSFDYENNMYNYSDLENPIQLYNNLSDGIYYIGKWVDNNTIAVLDTNNNVTIYDVNIESGTSSVLDTSTIYSENKIIEFQNNIFNSGFIVNKNDTLSVNTKKYTGYELIKLSKDEKDYVYQTITTATPNDIRRNITAYSNGEKITGTMIDNGDVTIEPTIERQTKSSGYYNSLQVNSVTSSIDSNIKPENIKKDVSILGVTGTYDGNQVENQVKVFETEELMNSDTNPQNGNLALVYRDKRADLVVGNTYTKLYIPNTITFDSAITSVNNIVLDTGNSLNSPSVGITTTAINFYRPGLPPQIVNTVQYSSTDGITYTRTDELKEELTIEEIYNEMYTQITIQENNYELLNQMFKGFDTYFGGLYVYKDDSYLLASTQLDAIADNVCLNNFYGKNGIEIGTLQNTTNLSKDQLKTRIILFNKFNEMTTSETNLAFAFSGLDIKSAPLFDTSNVTEMEYMYEDCTNLVDLPLYDTSNVTNFYNMVNGCPLSNDSLNNLMLMAVNCNNKSYNGNKTLKTFGLTREQAQICTTLSNYQAFLDAGWTNGY